MLIIFFDQAKPANHYTTLPPCVIPYAGEAL